MFTTAKEQNSYSGKVVNIQLFGIKPKAVENQVKIDLHIIIDRFKRHVNLCRIIFWLQVKESHTLYIYIYIFMYLLIVYFFTVIRHQVFLTNANILCTIL